MAADPARRGPASTATLVAVPVALAVGLVSLWLYGAFESPPPPAAAPAPQATTAVTMAAPALAPEVATVCRAVIAKLPETVRVGGRRPVTAGAEQNAAYGDPAITLACGTVQPSFPATSDVWGTNGVCWFARPGVVGTVWTTVDRQVPVTVTVPGGVDGSSQSVIPFASAIAEADPRTANPPAGCG